MRLALICFSLALAAAGAYQLYSAVTRAATSRDAAIAEQTIENYAKAARECRKKWPLANAFRVHECAMELFE